MKNRIKLGYLALLLAAIGCTPLLIHQLDQQYGVADSNRYLQAAAPLPGVPEYWQDIRPVLEKRCTVCHGCYDSPCQQNLTSWEGITRGGNPEAVYAPRLLPGDPTRLFVDAQSPAEWREKNFHPILNERENTPLANLQGSVLYRLLDLKRKNPLPEQLVLNSEEFTFALNREQSCPAIETIDAFEKEHPRWGMPYGLPALSEQEFSLMEKWLIAGAPSAPTPTFSPALQKQIEQWELFFNGDSLKQRLMSRYIYEHLFLAHIYFDEISAKDKPLEFFFRLVRSSTPPGLPIKEVTARRPYDDPGVSLFWYRLRRDEGSVVEKTHLPYALNSTREAKWKKWFVDAKYTVNSLPSYEPELAANPFVTFQALPSQSRYRFLLDEAQFSVDNFIKGPVCRGQVALGVIDDHSWVFFVDPDVMEEERTTKFLAEESNNLRLPNESESNVRILEWLKYSLLQQQFLDAKAKKLDKVLGNVIPLTEKMIWDGKGDGQNNDNAALTIFRHTDSATVVKGLVGQAPKTAWVIGYPLLERIHYLLVAGYDVYGNVGHQLNTRLYMDFLRMEGEANFLDLLPMDSRIGIRDFWYRDTSDRVKNFVYGKNFNLMVDSGITYKTDDPKQELYDLLANRIGKNVSSEYRLTKISNKTLRSSMERLQQVRGEGLAVFPQNSILRIDDKSGHREYFTLINNSAYSNLSELFGEDKRRRPAEDYLTVVPGILGAYPNAFFQTTTSRLPDFISQMNRMKTEEDFTALANDFAIRRTNSDFWAFSDSLHAYYRGVEPIRGGMLDYNRLENR